MTLLLNFSINYLKKRLGAFTKVALLTCNWVLLVVYGYSQDAWSSYNIGIPEEGLTASAPVTVGQWLVARGGGSGIGGLQDSFHLAAKQQLMLGNIEVEVRFDLGSINTQPQGTECGIMLRHSAEIDSAFACLVVTAGGEVKFKWRSAAGFAAAESFDYPPEGSPFCWLRLVRSGSLIAGYQSADGVNWRLVGSAAYNEQLTSMTAPYQVGICVTSQDTQSLSEGTFDHFKVLPWVPQKRMPIIVSNSRQTAAIKLWLRADWNASYDESSRVTFWEDLSGYANDAVSGPLNRPILVHDSIGGKPALDFQPAATAERKFMTVQSHESLTGAGGTLFVVARWPSSQVDLAGIVSKGTSSAGYFMGVKNMTVSEAGVDLIKALPRYRIVNTSRSWPAESPFDHSVAHLLCGEFTNGQASSLRLRSDGFSLAAGLSPTLAADTKPLYVGQMLSGTAAYPFVGQVAEILLFDRALDDETRKNLEQYFRLKYDLPSVTTAAPQAPQVKLGSAAAKDGIYSGNLVTDAINVTVPENAMVFYSINDGPKLMYSGPFVPPSGTRVIKFWVEKPGYPVGSVTTLNMVVDEDTRYVAKTGLKLWLRADAGIARTAEGGVTAWKSQATSVTLEAKGVEPYMPAWSPAGSHGKPVVSFLSGTSSRMTVSGGAPALNLDKGHTVYVVARPATELQDADTGVQPALLSRTSASSLSEGYQLLLRKEAYNGGRLSLVSRVARAPSTSGGTNLFYEATSATSDPSKGTYLSGSSWNVLSSRTSATTTARVLRINVKDVSQPWAGTLGGFVVPSTDLVLGASNTSGAVSQFFTGDLAEVLIYDRILASREVKEMDAYLAGRYGLPDKPIPQLACSHKSGTYTSELGMVVSYTSDDNALISYRVQEDGAWSGWTTGAAGEVTVSMPATDVRKTYIVEAKAEKSGFATAASPLSRTFTFDPDTADVPRANLKMWLRADVGVTAASNMVTTWTDQSGQGNDLVASGASRPQLVPSASGSPAFVKFGNGTAVSRMTKAAGNTGFKLGELPDNDWAVYAVARPGSFTGAATLVEQTSDSPAGGFLLQLDRAALVEQSRLKGQVLGNGAVFSTTPSYPLEQGFHLFSQVVQQSESPSVATQSLQINRGQSSGMVNQAKSTSTTEQVFSLGARRSATTPEKLIGDIAELLIYDKPLTTVEVDALEASLTRRHVLSNILQLPKLALPGATPDRGCWKPGTRIALSHSVPGVSYRFRFWLDGAEPGNEWFSGQGPFQIDPSIEKGFVNIEVQAVKAGYQTSDSLVYRMEIDVGVSQLPRDNLSLWLRGDKGVEGDVIEPVTNQQSKMSVQRWYDQSGGTCYFESLNISRRPTGGESAAIKVRDSAAELPASVIRFPFASTPGGSALLQLKKQGSEGVETIIKPGAKIIMICRFYGAINPDGRPSYSHRTFLHSFSLTGGPSEELSMYAYIDGVRESLGVSRKDKASETAPSVLYSNVGADRNKPIMISATIGSGFSVFPGLGRAAKEAQGSWPSAAGIPSSLQEVYIGGARPFAFTGYLPGIAGFYDITEVQSDVQVTLAKGMRVDSSNLDGAKSYIQNPLQGAGVVRVSKDPTSAGTATSFSAGSFMEGEIAELLVFDDELPVDEEKKVYNYLLERYVFEAKKPFAAPTITPAVGVLRQGAAITVIPPAGTSVFTVNGQQKPADQPCILSVGGDASSLFVHAVATPSHPGYAASEVRAAFVIDQHADLVSKPGLKLWARGDMVVESDGSGSVESWLDLSGNGRHLTAAAIAGTNKPVVFRPQPVVATATVSNGSVDSVSIQNGGGGYDAAPLVMLVGGGGNGATAVAQVDQGVVTLISITSGGSGYSGPPTVVVSAPFNQKPYVRFRASAKNVLQAFTDGLDTEAGSVFAVLRRTTNGPAGPTRIAGSYFDPPDVTQVVPAGGYAFNLSAESAKTVVSLRTGTGPSGIVSQQLAYMFGRPEDHGILFLGNSFSGSVARFYDRGNEVKTSNGLPLLLPSQAPFFVGGSKITSEYLDADVAELFVYDRDITKEELDNITVYVQERYGMDIIKKLPAPVPSHLGGTYAAPVPVRLKSLMPGCTIRYVLGDKDESPSSVLNPSVDPPDGQSVVFNQQDVASFISVAGGRRCLKARAFRDGFLPSDVVVLEYQVDSSAIFNRSGLSLWLRADTGVLEDSGKVLRWRDQSGLGNDAVGPQNINHRPQWVSGVDGLSGPVVKFSEPGSTLPVRLEVPNQPSLNTGTMTMIAVARKTGTSSGIVGKKGGLILRLGGTVSGGSVPLPQVIVSTNGVASQVGIASGQFNMVSGSYDGAYRRVSNGATSVSKAYASQLTRDSLPLFIGPNAGAAATSSAAALQGEVAELLVFNRGLSTSEIQEVELYLGSRHGRLVAPELAAPEFWPNPGSSGGTFVLSEPEEIGLYGPEGATIYWTDDPLLTQESLGQWQVYQQPMPVFYTRTFRAFCREDGQPSRTSGVVQGTFWLDPEKYPAPQPQEGDDEPPVITLQKPVQDNANETAP